MTFNVTFSESDPSFNVEVEQGQGVEVGFSNLQIINTGTDNHDELLNRELPDQHPIESITKLRPELDDKIGQSDCLSNQDIENLLKGVI